MTRDQIVKMIKESHGKIMRVTFIKRSTQEERVMMCRMEVKSHLRGGERKYDFEEYELIGVFDMQKQQYRTIPIEGIISLKLNGEESVVSDTIM